jgi:hypothetical protein
MTIQNMPSQPSSGGPEPEQEPEMEPEMEPELELFQSYVLTNASVSKADSGNFTLTLGATDLNEVKRLPGLCTTQNNCFLTTAPNSARDMNSNILARGFTLDPFKFVEDTIQPSLESFTFDLNSGKLILTYDETVSSSSFDVTAISFADSTKETEFILTTGCSVVSSNGLTVNIDIGDGDLDSIKLKERLWSSGYIYISISGAAATDMNSNPSAAVPHVPSSRLFYDTTPPKLEHFDLDMDTGLLTLSFSEVMNITSLKRELFQLLSASSSDENNALQLLSEAGGGSAEC